MGTAFIAHADVTIEGVPASAATGAQITIGQCPCFRWAVQATSASGKIETREFLISSDALLRFQQTHTLDFGDLGSRIYTMGPLEALYKRGHVGVGFKGVTFGENPDLGYGDLLRTGFYALANIVQTDSVRFGVRTGYDWDRFTNTIGKTLSRGAVDQAFVMQWNAGAWSGEMSAYVGLNTDHLFDTRYLDGGTQAGVRARIVSFSDFELGLAAQAGFEHDGFRELLGLDPNDAVAKVLMDLSMVERKHTR